MRGQDDDSDWSDEDWSDRDSDGSQEFDHDSDEDHHNSSIEIDFPEGYMYDPDDFDDDLDDSDYRARIDASPSVRKSQRLGERRAEGSYSSAPVLSQEEVESDSVLERSPALSKAGTGENESSSDSEIVVATIPRTETTHHDQLRQHRSTTSSPVSRGNAGAPPADTPVIPRNASQEREDEDTGPSKRRLKAQRTRRAQQSRRHRSTAPSPLSREDSDNVLGNTLFNFCNTPSEDEDRNPDGEPSRSRRKGTRRALRNNPAPPSRTRPTPVKEEEDSARRRTRDSAKKGARLLL